MVLPATASVLPAPRIGAAAVDVNLFEQGDRSPVRQSEGPSSGEVLHVFSAGFYLAIDDHHTSLLPGRRLLPVMSPEAVQLPFGITVPQLASGHLTSLRPGICATVVDASSNYRIEFPSFDIDIVRKHRPLRLRAISWPALDSERINAIDDCLRPGLFDLPFLARTLVAAIHDEDELGVDAGVRALLGRGPGSTPSGDDALCGIALALHSFGRSRSLALLSDALGTLELSRSTPAFSAALIHAAVAGHCVPEAASAIRFTHAVLDAPSADRKLLSSAVSALDRIGHSSGHDLFTGFLAVLGFDHQSRSSPHFGSAPAL